MTDDECTCPTGHTVGKLGHCRTCPWYRTTKAPVQPCVLTEGCAVHGAEHDFDWAIYMDDQLMTGVCACGMRQIDYDLPRLP